MFSLVPTARNRGPNAKFTAGNFRISYISQSGWTSILGKSGFSIILFHWFTF